MLYLVFILCPKADNWTTLVLTHGFSWGWGTPSLRRTHEYRNLLFTTKTTKPKPRFWYMNLLYNKNYKAKPRFCKGPQEVQKCGITPPCREGERKTPFTELKLHTNWEGESAHKWSSVFLQRHHEQARCCRTVCPEIPRRSCQETPIYEQKGNNTRTGDH